MKICVLNTIFNDVKITNAIQQANMSPNLSSAHFVRNKRLYEQVLFNLFSLVGVARKIVSGTLQSAYVIVFYNVILFNILYFILQFN